MCPWHLYTCKEQHAWTHAWWKRLPQTQPCVLGTCIHARNSMLGPTSGGRGCPHGPSTGIDCHGSLGLLDATLYPTELHLLFRSSGRSLPQKPRHLTVQIVAGTPNKRPKQTASSEYLDLQTAQISAGVRLVTTKNAVFGKRRRNGIFS